MGSNLYGPQGRNTTSRRIWDYMKGSARDGGTISADVSLDLGLPLRLASAHLASMAKHGWLERVGTQKFDGMVWGRDYTVFVRRDEVKEYDHE